MNKKWLAGPYLVWMVGFIVIPLLLIVYYGLTDKSGAFTLANAKILFQIADIDTQRRCLHGSRGSISAIY